MSEFQRVISYYSAAMHVCLLVSLQEIDANKGARHNVSQTEVRVPG